ncbi:hypothetical protein P154DRAFT_527978 [Amniculicola lignicola CBS 123094]|uniref:Uncharacterized protein n=1 Tax=Amniculicola lignicola CBS 123094 TaxID=1392246 RepID=A0A6A5VUH7_9PLEO|nr:hypothetical protein P154DRAFT_527978 [Amniculicola lignicola CBS 123094]
MNATEQKRLAPLSQDVDSNPDTTMADDLDMPDVGGEGGDHEMEDADEEARETDGGGDDDEWEDDDGEDDDGEDYDGEDEGDSDLSEVDPPHSKRRRELPQLSEDKKTITYKTVYGDDDPSDPVVAEYDVYLNDESELEYYLLQYMDREPDQPTSAANNSLPTEVRVKRDAGFMEVDIPIDVHTNYDRAAGVRYGEALRKTKAIGQKAYGIAGGFEKVMPKRNTRAGAADDDAPVRVDDEDERTIQEYVENFDDANAKGHVLNTKTYGGRVYKEPDWKPLLYAGAFRGSELHLVPISGVAQLQTQVHHVDAVSQLETINRRREKESTEPAKTAEPKAFMPTVKKAAVETSVEQIQNFLKRTAEEPWVKLRYHDEDVRTLNPLTCANANPHIRAPRLTPHTRSSLSTQRRTPTVLSPHPTVMTPRGPLLTTIRRNLRATKAS